MFIAEISGTFAFVLLLLGLGFIIFVHELGHFLVAKAVGIRCTQFAIGFGQALFCFRKGLGFRFGSTEKEYGQRIVDYLNGRLETKPNLEEHFKIAGSAEPIPVQSVSDLGKLTSEQLDRAQKDLGLGETEYRFNWMPLGGYVKMLGQEDLDPTKVSEDPRSYNRKPIWARMCVISAGVIMNIFFGVIFFIGTFLLGAMFPPAEVGEVKPGMPAATAPAEEDPSLVGIKPGDEIIAINGKAPSDFTSVKIAVALSDPVLTNDRGQTTDPGEKIIFRVRRPAQDGQPERELTFHVTPVIPKKGILLPSIGLTSASRTKLVDSKEPQVRERLGQALASFDLEPGMNLTAVDGKPIEEHWHYLKRIAESGGHRFPVTFTGDAGETTVAIKPISELQIFERKIDKKTREQVPHLLGMIPPIIINNTDEKYPAHGVLEAGDIVSKVGDIAWPTTVQFQQAIQDAGGQSVDITVRRDGQPVQVQLAAKKTAWWKLWQRRRIGVEYNESNNQASMVGRLLPDSPFRGKLEPGSIITAINGEPIEEYNDIRIALEAAGDQPIQFDVIVPLGGGQKDTVEVSLDDSARAQLAQLAWVDPIGMFEPLRVEQRAGDPVEAVGMGIDKTILFLENTYVTILQLVKGSVGLKYMSGPVGIINMGQKLATDGISYLLFFMGLISVNLAVINFLPLPIVDGGHFVLLLIEKLRGKPVPLKIQQVITVAGLLMLASIFLYVTYYDIMRLVE